MGVPSEEAGRTEASDTLRVMDFSRRRLDGGREDTKAVRCATRLKTRVLCL